MKKREIEKEFRRVVELAVLAFEEERMAEVAEEWDAGVRALAKAEHYSKEHDLLMDQLLVRR